MIELARSARNALKGMSKKITLGAVNTEAIVAVGNGLEIVALITRESGERLQFEIGKIVYAVVGVVVAQC